MALVRFSREGNWVRPGYLVQGTVFDLSARVDAATDALGTLETVPSSLPDGNQFRRESVSLHPPTAPSKVVRLVGCYDHDTTDEGFDPHAEAAGFTDMATPSLWVAPVTTLTGHESTVVLPRQADTVVPGVELVAVVGREIHEPTLATASGAVAGYTVCIDVAVRDATPGLEGYRMFDTFLPTGPGVVAAGEVTTESLGIGLRKNGSPEGSRSTTELRFSVAEMIQYVARVMTLYPGDVVTTGSPLRGVSPVTNGDEIEAWVETVGTIQATVRTEERV